MINIGTYAVPKNNKNGNSITKTVVINKKSGGGNFEPHYIWGQYFDDTQDITGEIKNVTNISATGRIHGNTIESTNVETVNLTTENANVTGNLNADNIEVDKLDAPYIHGDEVNSDKFTVGAKEKGQWIIDEDDNIDLNIHTELNKTFRVKPNEKDVLNVCEDTTKISNKLDLSNVQEGTKVSMGKTNVEANNTNIKSVVQDGFYFTDNENNVAIGISNNYIQTGIDIGSPNFLSGSYGWRIQPDGTAEFQNLKVDGNLDVYVITYNEMRATNGIMLVTDCGCIIDAVRSTISNVDYWIFTIDEFPPFAIDDYVQLQYKVDETRIFSFKGIVTAIGSDGRNTVRVLPLAGFEGEGTSNDDRGVTTFSKVDPDTSYGQYLIRIGNKTDKNRQTIIKLNPYDGGYIDFMTGLKNDNTLADNDSIRDNVPTATRIGNLAGVTYKGTTLEGYGLFSDNAYLSGAIKNLENKWSLNSDGSGQVANKHIEWDKDGNLTIKIGDTNIVDYINTLDGKITSTKTELEGSITATAQSLTSDYTAKITSATTDLEGKITTTKSELEGKVTQTAQSLTSDYTEKISDLETDVDGKITSTKSELEGKITQSAQSLTSDYTAKITEVNGKITTATSNFTQTANSISGRVTNIENDYVTSSQLQQTADSITASVSAQDYGKIKIGYKDNWEQGSTGGESAGMTYEQIKSSSSSRIRTKTVHRCTSNTRVYFASNFQVDLIYFDDNMKVASTIESGWTSANSSGYASISIPSNAKYIAILLKKTSGENITVSEVKSANVLITTDAVLAAGEVSLLVEDGLSKFNVTADRINLNGYTTVNGNFAIDNSGNVSVNGNITAKTLSYGGVNVSSSMTINSTPASLYLITSNSAVELKLPPPDLYNGFMIEIIPLKSSCILRTQKPTNNLAEDYLQYRKNTGGFYTGASQALNISQPTRVYAYGSFWYVLDGVY